MDGSPRESRRRWSLHCFHEVWAAVVTLMNWKCIPTFLLKNLKCFPHIWTWCGRIPPFIFFGFIRHEPLSCIICSTRCGTSMKFENFVLTFKNILEHWRPFYCVQWTSSHLHSTPEHASSWSEFSSALLRVLCESYVHLFAWILKPGLKPPVRPYFP